METVAMAVAFVALVAFAGGRLLSRLLSRFRPHPAELIRFLSNRVLGLGAGVLLGLTAIRFAQEGELLPLLLAVLLAAVAVVTLLINGGLLWAYFFRPILLDARTAPKVPEADGPRAGGG